MTRVFVTGVGPVTAVGVGRESFWRACMADQMRVAPIPETWRRSPLNSELWVPMDPVSFPDEQLTRIEQKQLDPVSRNGLRAAFLALDDAGLPLSRADAKRNTFRIEGTAGADIGVFVGTGIGGIHTISESYAHQICSRPAGRLQRLRAQGMIPEAGVPALDQIIEEDLVFPKRFNAFTVAMLMPNACAAAMAIKLSITGPAETCTLACASGAAAVGHGYRAVSRGDLQVALVGGSEYLYDAYGTVFRSFDAVKALVHGCPDPMGANRPFDARRSGFLFSQGGAAMLVLESEAHMSARGASPIAEILGFEESTDAHSIMMMAPSGREIERMLEKLFKTADTPAEAVGYVNAHGTGTELNDATEAAVIARVYPREPRVNSTKALLGHTMGASGAIEAVVTALTLFHQQTHGMPNLSDPVQPLGFVKKAGPVSARRAVSHSFAFGGHNTALMMGL